MPAPLDLKGKTFGWVTYTRQVLPPSDKPWGRWWEGTCNRCGRTVTRPASRAVRAKSCGCIWASGEIDFGPAVCPQCQTPFRRTRANQRHCTKRCTRVAETQREYLKRVTVVSALKTQQKLESR